MSDLEGALPENLARKENIMISIGDTVTVKPHTTYQSLSKGTVIDPPKQHRHNGYRKAIVTSLLNDEIGGVEIQVTASDYDIVPESTVQRTADAIAEQLKNKDIEAWHNEAIATPHVKALMEHYRVTIEIWGSNTGTEPLEVKII